MALNRVGLLGYGSAGARHWRNLRALRSGAEIVIHDPPRGLMVRAGDFDVV